MNISAYPRFFTEDVAQTSFVEVLYKGVMSNLAFVLVCLFFPFGTLQKNALLRNLWKNLVGEITKNITSI